MEENKLNNIITSIQDKLGEDNSSIIADDLGILITENNNAIKEMNKKDEENTILKDRNEKLMVSNGNLLQQISVEDKTNFNISKSDKNKDEKPKPFSFRSAFDKNGDFKE